MYFSRRVMRVMKQTDRQTADRQQTDSRQTAFQLYVYVDVACD